MRPNPTLLCFFLIFSAAQAADQALQSALDTYISARDRALAAVKANPDAETRVLADLDKLIRKVVPAWKAPGFSAEGKLTLAALDEGDVGFGALDGVEYSHGDTIVIATTKPLVVRWLSDQRKGAEGKKNGVPASMTAAFRSDAFYTQALSNDSGAFLHGLVLVKAPAGADLAIVELAAFAQDLVMDRGPDTLLAVVVRGDRIFIAEEPLKAKLAAVPFCKMAMERLVARAKAEKDTDKSNAFEEQADRDYRGCFAQRLTAQPNYAEVQKQAQALVDLLR